ncbi:hypothetical protein CIW48_20200 [Methylobacterium sp. P1-11]|uniref:tetratricopeptide repeat protein n=1 Tax=Methylobacterium sp. P1-11 TaxID=2024616 RepID=UPI0011EE32DF|nr:tetratricopeptide repeat protein [Methylobacterium sp. P1-11]KAA0122066.1 hypothetical protein CIW48_20200 [Methylobacterium sp. P1-11]
MNMRPLQTLYNPNSQRNDDRFIQDFVARKPLLDMLLRRLRTARSDTLGAHNVLIGSRGMGKTTLLRRLAIAIERDPDLSAQFVALNFREEQYNVLTLADFWRNCGESLAEWAEAAGREDLAQRLDASLNGEAWASDDGAAEQFSNEMTALGKRAVLLVDNLDLILNALSFESNWAMRRRLLAAGGPIMIGASTHALTQAADRNEAFYEFFHPVYLDPLSAQETEQCMRAFAIRGGEHGGNVLRILDSQPERLNTLHRLTGGNPRVLALIYRLLGTGESDAAMADLELLLDQVTPYYKAKVEEYRTAQQRAVIDAIALHWDPVTTGDLARLTNLPATTLSPLLIRLRKDGFLEQVELSGAYGGHQLVERFLNVWYLMRHGTRRTKQKMRWLVAFLTSFYSWTELSEMAGRTPNRADWHRDYRLAFDEALKRQASYVEEEDLRGPLLSKTRLSKVQPAAALEVVADEDLANIGGPNHPTMSQDPSLDVSKSRASDRHDAQNPISEVRRLLAKAWDLVLAGNAAVAIPIYESVLALCIEAPDVGLREQVARALNGKARALAELGDLVASITIYDDVLARFADAPRPILREQVARAMINKAIILGQVGDPAAAITVYDDLLARFSDAPEPGLRERVAKALVNKAIILGQIGDPAAEIAVYDDVLARFADAPDPTLREQVARAMINKAVTLGHTNDPAGEIAIYDDLLARFADAPEPTLREPVARAMVNKAMALSQIGDPAAAITVYDDLLARLADAPEPTLREWITRAMVNKAMALGQIGDPAAEIAVYDDLLARFADAPETILREPIARAMINKAITLRQIGDPAAAITVYDDLLARFADAPELGMRERVARAMISKALTLGEIGDPAGEIAIYDDLLARFADAPELTLRERIARAMINKAITVGQIGDPVAEITVYDDLLARFADAPEPTLREQVARAMINKAITVGQIGDPAGEVAIYDDLLARFADAPEPTLREQVAAAMVSKAITVGQIGDPAAAITVYDDILARFVDAPEPTLREQVARAMISKAITLSQIGDPAAAITVYDDLLARFANAPETALREWAARAMVNKAMTLGRTGDPVAEIAVYDDLLARFGDAPEPGLREQVAAAMVSKAITLGDIGDPAAAITVYDDLLARFANAPETALREWAAKAMIGKALTLGEIVDSAAEIAAYDDLLARFADAPEPGLREQVARAMVNKAITFGEIGDPAAEIAVYDDVLARFAGAPEPGVREPVANAVLIKANALRAEGKISAAIDTFEDFLQRSADISPGLTDQRQAEVRIGLANLLLDFEGDLVRPEVLYTEASLARPLSAKGNLAWFLLLAGRSAEAHCVLDDLKDLPESGFELLKAAIEFAGDNLGSATSHLKKALDRGLDLVEVSFEDDLERLLRLAQNKGHGEHLLTWFEQSDYADKLAPLYVAFRAYVRGAALLRDVNPEVRHPAQMIYDRLDAPRRHTAATEPSKSKRTRRTTRRRKT